jgi:hypothetical protein
MVMEIVSALHTLGSITLPAALVDVLKGIPYVGVSPVI